jgi:hypothetical protein
LEEEQLIIYSSNHYSQQLIEGSRQAAQPVRYMGHFEFLFFFACLPSSALAIEGHRFR